MVPCPTFANIAVPAEGELTELTEQLSSGQPTLGPQLAGLLWTFLSGVQLFNNWLVFFACLFVFVLFFHLPLYYQQSSSWHRAATLKFQPPNSVTWDILLARKRERERPVEPAWHGSNPHLLLGCRSAFWMSLEPEQPEESLHGEPLELNFTLVISSVTCGVGELSQKLRNWPQFDSQYPSWEDHDPPYKSSSRSI